MKKIGLHTSNIIEMQTGSYFITLYTQAKMEEKPVYLVRIKCLNLISEKIIQHITTLLKSLILNKI